MIKRKFGMACLNITQGRFGGYSHKNINAYDLAGMDAGIDRFVTFNDLKVIGVHEYSRTGFANTVCFFDEQNNVTIAMTHCNIIPNGCKVGKVYHLGETVYFEGTKGNATGNHIHLEVGRGYQPSKSKINGEWQLKNLINIEDYFYIDSSYTNVKEDKGYAFSYDGNEVSKVIKEKYSNIHWNGLNIHLVKQNSKMDIMGIGAVNGSNKATYNALQTIDKIDTDRVVVSKVNCSYFQMKSGQSDEYGTHYGVFQGVNYSQEPKNDNLVVCYIDKANKVHCTSANNYWLTKDDVKLAFTPFWVGLLDGKDMDYYTTSYGDKRSLKNTQTAIMQDDDGHFIQAVFNTACTCWDVRKFAKEYGCTFVACLDSGGSSQMIYSGQKKVYTGRAIADVIAFVEKAEDEPSVPTKPSCEECKKKDTQINNLKAEIAMIKEDYEKELSLVNKKNEALVKTNTSLGKELKDAYHEISKLKGYVD